MQIVFEIEAKDLRVAQKKAGDILKYAPPSLRLCNPKVGTTPRRAVDPAQKKDPKIWWRFVVDAPAATNLADRDVRSFLDGHGNDVELVSPRMVVKGDLRKMTLADTVGNDRLKELGIDNRDLKLSADAGADKDLVPLTQLREESGVTPERRRELGLEPLETEVAPKITPERRVELGLD
jgi:hypothetical protein